MEQIVEDSKKQIKNPTRTGTGTGTGIGTDFEDLTSSTETVTESQELDELLVDYLESMEVYVRTTLDEENLLREGFINISHARMCMKPHLITLYAFPNDSTPEINASATTTTSPVNETDEASSTTDVDLNQDSNSNRSSKSKSPHPHLHRVLNMETSKDKTSQLRKIFGQTTPESLKKAQGAFHRVLERSVERANIMNRLKYLEGRILQITSLSMRAPTPTTTTTTTSSQQLQPQQQQLQNQNKDSHQSTGTGTGKSNPPQHCKSSSKKSKNNQQQNENEKENSNSSDILKLEKLSMSEENF